MGWDYGVCKEEQEEEEEEEEEEEKTYSAPSHPTYILPQRSVPSNTSAQQSPNDYPPVNTASRVKIIKNARAP